MTAGAHSIESGLICHSCQVSEPVAVATGPARTEHSH